MSNWIDQLKALHARLDTLGCGDYTQKDSDREILKDILRQACDVVRDASAQSAAEMGEIVAKAQDVINKGVNIAYGEGNMFDFMPSFAHENDVALVKDRMGTGLGQGTLNVFMSFFGKAIERAQASGSRPTVPAALRGTGPWSPDLQAHAKSTRLARFRPDVRTSVTDTTPLAQVIYQARCEIADDRISVPSRALISPGQSCLAIIGAGGWKNRDPMLHCYLLDDPEHIQKDKCFSPGFAELAYTMAMDEDRKLVFIADTDRVKSYSWDVDPDLRFGIRGGQLPPVHTLDSDTCSGWISVLPNGRIVRAGCGEAFVWNIDALEQHGPDKKLIGAGEYDAEDSWRENEDGTMVEYSTGSTHHAAVAFADPTFHPAVWHRHAPTGNMLCGTSGRRDENYACASIDLEHGGQIVARYLGHGGDVEDISTSEGDANAFATAGSDGYARLFDVRQPLPVMTFDHGCLSEYCSSVVLAHPDALFSAGMNTEQIKMWDIRAKETVYELATGNNAVASMAWDPKRSALYAATECEYMDRLGFNHDYRRARIPRWADEFARDSEEDEDASEYYEDEDEEERCWPQRAHHGEDYFGYAFDAGEHRIYRYAFKEDPDPKQLPPYGQASMHDSGW
ncbi:hypothetical protein DAEQUDRAFT_762447 [Daedalea quercina L-15889]|uniref:Uncharacterized protein n=1 Tax=Daedalea quercina L-15889 TaxID=1314783 RepID=A0A165T8Y8_9APHY|nr:hypothetical protein DAEQUDRAFT_762447 [Daedalea quercina L-15889]